MRLVGAIPWAMAGKRQHYVPRLLQRGFLDDASDAAERTWLHRRGAEARLVSIRHVGVEDWFYSRKSPDGTPTLDDTITALERDLASSVEALRASAPGSSIDVDEAAHTVAHLVMRTAHIRRIISAGMIDLINETEPIFTDADRLGDMLGLNGTGLDTSLVDAFRDIAEELESAGIPAAFSERLMAFEARELGEGLAEQTVATLDSILPQLTGDLEGMVRDAHNSSLETLPESDGWISTLSAFEWTIEAGVDLVLPDAVALAYEANGRLMPLLFTKAADIRIVVMPVSANRILVGRIAGSAPIDLGTFNSQAVASSETFFIGAKPFDEEKLEALIGSSLSNTIKETVSEVVREVERPRSTASMEIAPVDRRAYTRQSFSYSVRLADFGDETLAQQFAEVLHREVDTLARELPLHELDGFTLAVDYDAALANLDRGDPNLPPATSGALAYGAGAAKPVTVIRDSARKEHLVVAAGLAEKWLSPDADVRTDGIYSLKKMLAGVAHSTLYATAREISFTFDTMGRELHSAIATTPSGYWSARQAAFVDPDQGQGYADLVIDGLDFAEREIADERARIPESGDIRNTTLRALECTSAVVGHAADWLGHRDGLAEGQLFKGSDLPERLKTHGLDRWIELFGRDLAACYGPEGVLNIEVVTGLSSHVERLFWSLGIYCWPEGDYVRCLVTDQFFSPPELP